MGWKISVLFGYAELGNEVAEGVASLELALITLELIEVEELSGLARGSTKRV